MFKQSLLLAATATAAFLQPALAQDTQLQTARIVEPKQRAEFELDGKDSAFKYSYIEDGSVTDNEAALQFRVTKNEQQFLATLPGPSQAGFLTAMKPCSILLPHTHPRATEFYQVLFGTMSAGVAQENGAAQNITIPISPGEVFVVPQGLLHFNHNQECEPLVFLQTFNDADPGAINMIGAFAAFNDGDKDGQLAMKASGTRSVDASPQGAFALDQKCLKRCGYPKTGAPGTGLEEAPAAYRTMMGM